MNWKFAFICLITLVALVLTLCPTVYAATWTVFDAPEWTRLPDWSPRQMVFTFENNALSLNTTAIAEDTGSSSESWTLLLTGDWAAFGTVDASGNLIADPYASFVYQGYGGYVDWAEGTPHGYSAPLMLGNSFAGDAAATYEEFAEYAPTGYTITGTVVRWDSLPMRQGERELYTALNHTFSATYTARPLEVSSVPEPSGIIALLTGIGGLAFLRRSSLTKKSRNKRK